MNAPFLLPVSWTGAYSDVLIAADTELICATEACSGSEKRYIELALNHHEALCDLVEELIAPLSRNSDAHNRARELLRKAGA